MDFRGARIFIDSVNDPVAPGAKRLVTRQIALETFSRVGLLRQQFDGALDERLQRRSQPEDPSAAGSRINQSVRARHGSAQASSWVMTLPA